MIKKAKALIPRSVKSFLRTVWEYALHAPLVIKLKAGRRRQLAINLISRDRRILFVSEAPSGREVKLASGLRQAGWEVTLLYRKKAPSLDLGLFHDAWPFLSPWEAIERAHRAGTRVIHNFSYFGDKTSIRLMQNKPGRVIFDFYDYIFSMEDGLETPELKGQWIADQYFCIEAADAICCRDMQMQYRRKETRIGRGKPLILFPEYCWNDGPLPERRADGEIHIVQVGWMGLETLGEIDAGGYRVFEKFVDAGCHLHIYLHPIYPRVGSAEFDVWFADYIELGRRTGRVHLHSTVGPEKLVGELTSYDFGVAVNNGLVFDMPWSTHNPARFPYCGSSRLFDYLDAGLGIIIQEKLKFMSRTFRSHGIVFDASQLLKAADIKAALARRPDRDVFQCARVELSIARNIGRLVQFYENLK